MHILCFANVFVVRELVSEFLTNSARPIRNRLPIQNATGSLTIRFSMFTFPDVDFAPNQANLVTSSLTTNYLNGPQAVPSSSGSSSSAMIRRGPGRPRLKPTGPPNTGSRGTYRPRKPAKPLPVPLPSDGNVNCSVSGSNATPYSTYLYDFQDQPLDS